MKLTDADLVRGRAPGLSALVTNTHTQVEVPIYSRLVRGCHPSQWGYMRAAGAGEGMGY